MVKRPPKSAFQSADGIPALDQAHVVVLTNYLRRHHALVFQEVAQRVGKLTVLLSTDMEPDRSWNAEWGDLNVEIQKSWMFTAKWKHSSGFSEPNFIHVPTDTVKRLRHLNPDIVFSYELGMRTAFCSLFRMLRRRVPLVMVGNMADHIENERGFFRRMIRRFIRRRVDFATYNGPSCKRYLDQLGYREDQLFHFPYCIDFDKAFAGEQSFSPDGHRHLVYSGMISERKGILPFTAALAEQVKSGNQTVTLSIAGEGPLASDVAALANENLTIKLLGNCNPAQLSDAYQAADICVFPTLGDEWGLVPIEAMASGLPVLGSTLAQSVEATVANNQNGWPFNPLDPASMKDAIASSLMASQQDLARMSETARESVTGFTPIASAEKFCQIIRSISGEPDLPDQDGHSAATNVASSLST